LPSAHSRAKLDRNRQALPEKNEQVRRNRERVQISIEQVLRRFPDNGAHIETHVVSHGPLPHMQVALHMGVCVETAEMN
jgi:hypothetical protein